MTLSSHPHRTGSVVSEQVDDGSGQPSKSRILPALGLTLTAAAAFFHVYYITRAGALWRDEANTAALASMASLSEIWAHLPFDSFPMLWPAIVRFFQWIGAGSDFALRCLGCGVGVVVLGALWLNARLLKFSAPIVAVAILGFNPTVIRWGDSLRAYGIGLMLVLITFALVWKVATAPSKRVILLAAISAVASAQALYHNACVLFAIGIAGLAVAARGRHWSRCAAIIGIGAIAALSLAPYIGVIQRARSWDIVSRREFDVSVFAARLFEAISAAGVAAGWVCIGVLLIAVLAACAAQLGTRGTQTGAARDLALYSLLTMLVAIAATFGFLKIVSYPTQPWYYLPLLGLLAVSADAALSTISRSAMRQGARLVFAAAIVGTASGSTWQLLQVRQTNIDVIAAKLRASATAGDVIVTSPWYLGVSLRRYYDGPVQLSTIPPIEDLRVHRKDVLKAQMETMNAMDPVPQSMARALRSGRRVWIVGALRFPRDGEPPPLLAPAPYESFGWHEGAYLESWTMQVCHLLLQHAQSLEEIPVDIDQPVNAHETPRLFTASGWR